MKTLPPLARLYLMILWGVAALLLIMTAVGSTQQLVDHLPLLVVALPLFVLADFFGVDFDVHDGGSASATVSDAPGIFLIAIVGAPGVLVVAAATLIVDVLRRRDWYRGLFNAAERTITYMAMLGVYLLIIPYRKAYLDGIYIPFSDRDGLLAFLAIATVYYTINTLLVATIVALAQRQRLLPVYIESYRMVHWVHFITMPTGAAMAALWKINPWMLGLSIFPLIMGQRSFKAVAAWQNESRRSKALAREARQLASKLERLQDTATAMMATLAPGPLLETVSTRLAALLDASASWVVLLDLGTPRLVASRGVPEDFELDERAYVRLLQRERLGQFGAKELAELHPGRSLRWGTVVVIPLALEQRVLGAICLALDRPTVLAEDDCRVLQAFAAQAALVMEHAQLFEELRHKQDELVRSSKLAALGTFSAGIAHEFNNLLAGILGYAQLGLMSDSSVQAKNEALEVAVQACLRGRSITSGLLTFAQRRDPQRNLHQITEIVEETLVPFERQLAKRNIHIERCMQPVPPTVCDAGQISQVLLNLITNARDAMSEQDGGTITISLRQKAQQIELSVTDTGCGIPADLRDQIFQPFMTTKGALGGSTTPGTGLGLAISHGIIESHGGTIEIPRSEIGRGTTVTVRLPIISQPPSGVKASSTAQPEGLRIMIVDDEPMVAEPMARLLESRGHQVVMITDAEEALRRYSDQPYDLVISDVIMPNMSGVEFLQCLRVADPQAQVLVMTGHAPAEQIDQMMSAGAFGIISKPFIVDELLTAIGRGAPRRQLSAA